MGKALFGFFEPKKFIVKTEPFYKKYAGMITINKKCIVTQVTDKAILVRELIIDDPEQYSTKPFWIPKSKIIELKELVTVDCGECNYLDRNQKKPQYNHLGYDWCLKRNKAINSVVREKCDGEGNKI